MKTLILILFTTLSGLVNAQSISGFLETQHRCFFNKGQYAEQGMYYFSLAGNVEYNKSMNDGNSQIKITLFGRYDFNDVKRSHVDFRELYYKQSFKNGYTSLGFRKIFWGVVESTNINDIINQKDMLEGIEGDYKLGELMWQTVFIKSFGTFESYIMPFHRRVRFPGPEGRFRSPLDLERDSSANYYRNDIGRWYPSFAVRYNNIIGSFDLGINFFHGLSREPVIDKSSQDINIYYPIINQFGGDFQFTLPGMLLKTEIVNRLGKEKGYWAIVSGFEYTIGNFLNSSGDLGIVSEYLFDERGNNTIRGMDNDLFLGLRFSGNDLNSTEILAGTIIDLSKTTRLYSFQASRRFNEVVKFELEGKWFRNVSHKEFVSIFRNDSMLQVNILIYVL
jgi:hypothetical protein